MHRYWYGLFPEDYSEKVYDDPWVKKYSSEIGAAVDLLDEYLGKLMEIARKTDRVLTIVTSMGQHANPKLTRERRIQNSFDYRLEEPANW